MVFAITIRWLCNRVVITVMAHRKKGFVRIIFALSVQQFDRRSSDPKYQREKRHTAVKTCIHLLPGLNTLVGKVREGRAGNEAAHAGGDVQVPVFQNNLPLADHHLWGSTQLHALEHVVLGSLQHKHIQRIIHL